MNLDSKSPQKKLRRSLARFQQKYFSPQFSGINSHNRALLRAGAHWLAALRPLRLATPTVILRQRSDRRISTDTSLENQASSSPAQLLLLPFRRALRRFCRRFVRRLRFRRFPFRLALHLHQRVMRLLRTFAAFLLFALRLFLLRRLLDSRKFPQSFFSLFGSLASSRQLQREHLFDHRIKLRPFRHSNSFQFVANRANSSPQWPPFIEVRLDFRKRRRISRFRQQVADPVRRHFFHKLEGVNRSVQ